MELPELLLFLLATLNVVLAFFVFFHNSRSEVNLTFALTLLFLALWTYGTAFIITPIYPAAIWQNISFISGIGALTSFLYFSWVFPHKNTAISPHIKNGLWITGLILGVFPLISPIAHFLKGTPYTVSIQGTILGNLLTLYMLLLLGLTIQGFTKALRKARGIARGQMRSIIRGALIGSFFAFLFSGILPAFGNKDLIWFAPFSILIFVTAILRSIIKTQLFDIRLVIRRAIVYSALLGVILALFILLISIIAQRFNQNFVFNRANIIANIVASLIMGFSFDPLRRRLQQWTNQLLFRQEMENQLLLQNLSNRLNNVLGLEEALELVTQTIIKAVRLDYVVTVVFHRTISGEEIGIKQIKQIGYSKNLPLNLLQNKFIHNYFTAKPQILIVENFKQEYRNQERALKRSYDKVGDASPEIVKAVREHAAKRSVLRVLTEFQTSAVVPLFTESQLIGLILLGDPKRQEGFSQTDVGFLDLIAAQSISSIQKARLYEEDQMKSEFVSVASHELLTPISAMEGYLEVILNAKDDSVDPQAHGYLEKSYASVKRLSNLVRDLLSVSRIEANQLKMEPQASNMPKLIQETVDQLRFIAEDHKISLIYNTPQMDIPAVWVDPDRTSQILVNLVSNAIKYTKEGTVTINCEPITSPKLGVRVSVTDTGIGISREQQDHLFEKFYRAESAETTGIIGTGLGLYITKALVEKMHGTIKLTSSPGVGTTISITMPAVPS